MSRTAGLLGLPAAAAGLLSYLADRHWTLELLTHFRLQYVLLLLLALALLLALRRFAVAGLVAAAAVAAAAPVVAYRLVESDRCPDALPELRLLTLGLDRRDEDRGAVLARIRADSPDLVFLTRVDGAWAAELERSLSTAYPHRVLDPREDAFGVALLSRLPFVEGGIVYLATALPSVIVRVARPGGVWTLMGTHPAPAVGRDAWRRNGLQLDALAARVRAALEPTVVVGDLAVTPWSPAFVALLESARLEDSGAGTWVPGTWGGRVSLLRVPVDHVLHSSELCVVERRVGPDAGSRHQPLVLSLARRS